MSTKARNAARSPRRCLPSRPTHLDIPARSDTVHTTTAFTQAVKRFSPWLYRIHCVPFVPRQRSHVLDHCALCSVQLGDYRVEGRALLNLKRTRGHRTHELWGVRSGLASITSSHLGPLELCLGRNGRHLLELLARRSWLQDLGVMISVVPRASVEGSYAIPTLSTCLSRLICSKNKIVMLGRKQRPAEDCAGTSGSQNHRGWQCH